MTRTESHSLSRRLADGFTLLEVLVSSTILLGLLVLLLGACEGGTRFWNQSERRRAALREAGASLRLMGHDLRSAVITADPSSLLIRKETTGGTSLFFLVSHSSDHRPEATLGDLCATGYFLAPAQDREKHQDLYRFHASGHQVLEAVRSGKLPELYASAVPGTTNTELLARHVASLDVRPLSSGSPSDHPSALILNITTVDSATGALIAEAGADRAAREKLLANRGARLGSVVSLPPVRQSPPSQ
jgi:prepilin-type N-terminal cleavage/methylation domain-containing protein